MRREARAPAGPAWPAWRVREAVLCLEQQSFLWGTDVRSAAGNLLCRRGGAPAPLPAGHEVRAYHFATPAGGLVLHSTGLLLSPADGGAALAYLRPWRRLFMATEGVDGWLPAASGAVHPGMRALPGSAPIHGMLRDLLAWVCDYELWVRDHVAATHREDGWRLLRRTAAKAVRWLPPEASLEWLRRGLAGGLGGRGMQPTAAGRSLIETS